MASPNPPTHSLTKTSPTSFTANIVCEPNLNVDLYLRRSASASDQYNLFSTRSGPGSISVTGRTPYEFYQTFTVTRDAQNNVSTPYFASVDLNIPNSALAAIRSKWMATPALVSMFKGGLFANEAPEGLEGKPLVMPYCIMREEDTDFHFMMSEQYFETSSVYFVVFAPGAAITESCISLIREKFDWQNLPFVKPETYTVAMHPTHSSLTSENFRYKDGNLIFRGSVNYDIIINRIL